MPFAFEYPRWLPPQLALPVMVGSACALGLVSIIVLVRSRRPKSQSHVPEKKPFSVNTTAKPEFDPFVTGSASEKRDYFRRRGNAVKVLIRGPGNEKIPLVGYVLDRSSGGMALCAPKEFPNGTFLQVRPDSDSETIMWVKLQVRSARRENGDWHLGCKLIESPPWSVLLQFG